MSPTDFEFLLNMIGPKITKEDTCFRKSIPAQERLAVTIRFLATGDSYASLQYLFKISKQAISVIIPEVCDALIDALKSNIQIPTTEEEWTKVHQNFDLLWNFPHCLGALDGKHIVLQAPFNSGSKFFNYKSSFSIVMLALADANYNLLFVNVGCQGRISDGGVYKNSALFQKIEQNALNPPHPMPLPGRHEEIPYFFIGDEAFPLSSTLLKVYPGHHPQGSSKRIFNYRLCRARRVVENVFGIMSSVFRSLRKPLLLQPEKAEKIVLTIAHLHNFLRRNAESRNLYMPPSSYDQEIDGQFVPGLWRNEGQSSSFTNFCQIPRRSPSDAKSIRDELAHYFMHEGKLSWQEKYA